MISEQVLAFACKCAGRSLHHYRQMAEDLPLKASITAHARAIEQHEAFRQEVSDTILEYFDGGLPEDAVGFFHPFILPKTDPLVEALNDLYPETSGNREYAEKLRAALAARGLEVRKIGEGE